MAENVLGKYLRIEFNTGDDKAITLSLTARGRRICQHCRRPDCDDPGAYDDVTAFRHLTRGLKTYFGWVIVPPEAAGLTSNPFILSNEKNGELGEWTHIWHYDYYMTRDLAKELMAGPVRFEYHDGYPDAT